MPRDYAKQTRYTYVSSHSKYRRPVEWIVAIILILAIAGLGFYYAKSHKNSIAAKGKQILSEQKNVKKSPLAFVQAPTEPDVQFDFYSELQGTQVKVAVPARQAFLVQKTPTPSTPAVPTTGSRPVQQYFLQLGQFSDNVGASEMRVSLLFAGIDAEIVSAEQNGKTVYFVRQGPYANERAAKQMQQRLQRKGVSSQLMRMDVKIPL
ncbi:hypothetical protein AYO45_03040 [Gammaproteobacteria bacterium SCGC AG-212-F23]|nr:hypothetical protein AYO45_03040 [Gammaproteobacteria bacterium SCGC AG-212-F23]